ncbi:hypothetical protein NM688_g4929 [Phlebia brevispora]|uniref:Uncharacterized protein n=1 Tax=Phlebia brevispora TaxID=194682 RepID=A0ACC1T1S2_9APHY|nr:hypothetical protein NM688_g4929 [Phlebia brevispora]
MALTCRCFYEPAMEARWESIEGYELLMACFPQDVWNVSKDGEFISPPHPPSRTDWDRFLALSKHVRRLEALHSKRRSGFSINYSIAALRFLNIHRPVMKLFPNVRELHWTSDFGAEYASVLIGPLLHIADVSADDKSCAFILQALANDASSLQTLSITVEDRVPNISDVFKKSGHLFRSLQYLDCEKEFLSIDAIIRLSTIPLLQSISCSIELPESERDLAIPSAQDPKFFPSLRVLSFSVRTISPWVVALLQACTSPDLREVWVGIDDYPSREDLSHMFGALALHRALETIMLLPLIHKPASIGPGYVLKQSDITPLFACRSLQFLTLLDFAYNFDDNSLENMAIVWPHLRSIHVGICYAQSSPTRISLKTLHAFSTHCSELHTVTVPISFELVSEEDMRRFRPQPCLSLQSIGVDYRTPISDKNLLAAFVSALFPHASIHNSRALWQRGASNSPWEEINELLKRSRLVQT